MFANHISDGGLISEYLKHNSIIKRQITQLINDTVFV